MEKTKAVLDEVAAVPVGTRTFENTIKRIADQECVHSIASTICTFPSYPDINHTHSFHLNAYTIY